jgi:aminoglycoside phosphotransferase
VVEEVTRFKSIELKKRSRQVKTVMMNESEVLVWLFPRRLHACYILDIEAAHQL